MSTLDYQNGDEARKETPGPLRRLFGPSTADLWRLLAQEAGGQFVDGGFFGKNKVVVAAGPWTLTLDTYRVQTGKASTTYTRLRAPYVNPAGFRFTVTRAGLFTALGELLGLADIRVGQAAFDQAFVLQGTDPDRVRALFADPAVQALLAAQPRVEFRVKDDEGWFGTPFPQGVDELCFTAHGTVTDLDRLRALFDLFAAVLHRLCLTGSASEVDPGVRL